MLALTSVLFIWFWGSCFIFKYLSKRNLDLEILVKNLNDKNNEITIECIELEVSNKELLEANYKLVKNGSK